MKTLVTLPKLKELLDAFEKQNITHMVIAGFGLDGHRGYQTRPHQDVDIICLKKDSKKIVKLTKELGYKGEWFGNLFKIKRKDGGKADLAMAVREKNKLVTRGRIAKTSFPISLFKPQKGKIKGFEFKIAPNELLKTFALHAQKGKDKEYADKLIVDEKIMKKIKRVLKTQIQTTQR